MFFWTSKLSLILLRQQIYPRALILSAFLQVICENGEENQSQRLLKCKQFYGDKQCQIVTCEFICIIHPIISDVWNPGKSWTLDSVKYLWCKFILHLVKQMTSVSWIASLYMNTSNLQGEVLQVGEPKGKVRTWSWVCVLWEWDVWFWIKDLQFRNHWDFGRLHVEQGEETWMVRGYWGSTRKTEKCDKGAGNQA